jgi:hypothetical protein
MTAASAQSRPKSLAQRIIVSAWFVIALAVLTWSAFGLKRAFDFSAETSRAERGEPAPIRGHYDLSRPGTYELTLDQWYGVACHQSFAVVIDPDASNTPANPFELRVHIALDGRTVPDDDADVAVLTDKRPLHDRMSFREGQWPLTLEVVAPVQSPGARLESRYRMCGLERATSTVLFVVYTIPFTLATIIALVSGTWLRRHTRRTPTPLTPAASNPGSQP